MAITVDKVSFYFSDSSREIIKDLDLQLETGKLIVIAGANGSGKSSLLSLLAAEKLPANGSIIFNGQPVTTGKHCFFLQQQFQSAIDQTAGKLIEVSDYPEIMCSLLQNFSFGITWDVPISALSTGKRTQLFLSFALASSKELLLLDDPLAGFSPRITTLAWEMIKAATIKGKSVVIVSSDMDAIAVYADAMVVLQQGKVAFQGSPAEIFQNSPAIRNCGLRLPRVTHLVELLEKYDGFAVAAKPYTIAEARSVLTRYRQYGGKLLRKGITTGTCAAAAAKAAASILTDKEIGEEVKITLPSGQEIRVPVKGKMKTAEQAVAWVEKDGGDDPDVTHGLDIVATVRLINSGSIELAGGQGVGLVSRPGLALPVGEAAINPIPRQMINSAVRGVLGPGQGAEVEISVPGGERIAQKTLNPKLGIINGISILGTTGIVEPMSEDAFKRSLAPQIRQVQAAGFETVVLCPGNMGQKLAIESGFPQAAVIQMSNFVGFMLEECSRLKVNRVVLFGHIGKLVKVAAGIFQTHSKMADARLETMSAWALRAGAGPEVCQRILAANTTEEAVWVLQEHGLEQVFHLIAQAASDRAEQHTRGEVQVGTILTSLKGQLLGFDSRAELIGGELGWLR